MSYTRETINQCEWRFYFETKNSFKPSPSPATPTALTCSTCRGKVGRMVRYVTTTTNTHNHTQSVRRCKRTRCSPFPLASSIVRFFPSFIYFAGSWKVLFVPPSPCRRMVNFFYRSRAPLSTRNFTMSITPTASTDFTLDPNGAWSPWVVLFCDPGRPLPSTAREYGL